MPPVREKDFSRSQLWPPSSHNWMHPTAKAGLAMYPPGFDVGALRVQNGFWEIFWNKPPAGASGLSYEWLKFNPSNPSHLYAANAFNRVGRGWSFGPAHGMHDEARGYFQDVYGRNPTDMEKLDIEHDKAMWQDLQARWKATLPTQPPPSPPPLLPPKPVPPVVPPVQPPGLPPLSSPEQRAAELLNLLPPVPSWLALMIGGTGWALPLLTELVKGLRRVEDRVVARVIEGLRK